MSVFTSLFIHTSRPCRPRPQKGLFYSHQAWGQGSKRWILFLLPALSEGHLRSLSKGFSCSLGCSGPGNFWSRMWSFFLRTPCQARSSPPLPPLAALFPDLSQLAFSTYLPFTDVLAVSLSLPALSAWKREDPVALALSLPFRGTCRTGH